VNASNTSKSITDNRTLTPKNNEYIFYVVKLTGNDAASRVVGKDLQIEFCLRITGGEEQDQNCWSFVGKVNPDPAKPYKPHPFIVFTKSEVEKLKEERTKKARVDRKIKDYASSVKNHINDDYTQPSGITKHSELFVCDDGSNLEFNLSSPFWHYCPSEKKYYTGEPYDSAWIAKKHLNIAGFWLFV